MADFSRYLNRFRQHRSAVVGLVWIGLSILIAVFAYCLAPDNSLNANRQLPNCALRAPGFCTLAIRQDLPGTDDKGMWLGGKLSAARWTAVQGLVTKGDSLYFTQQGMEVSESMPASGTTIERLVFPLGTDKYGRCLLSRLLVGFRISLFVGLLAVAVSVTVGLFIGALGGYLGGKMDDIAVFLINTTWSIPTLLLVFAIVLAMGRGIGIIFLAVGLTMWVDVARIVRGQTMALKAMPFVEAARSMGFSHSRVLMSHLLPNLLGPLAVVAAGNFATAILLESGLSYLGFGVQPPVPSWGGMLNENYGFAISGKPYLALAPALAIMLTVLAFNLVGNGLRDAIEEK